MHINYFSKMKKLCISFFLCLTFATTIHGQESDSGIANFRSCLQSAMLGFRNFTEGDLFAFQENIERVTKSTPPTSTSKLPTEIEVADVSSSATVGHQEDEDSRVTNDEAQPLAITRATPRENIRYLLFTSKNKEQFHVMTEDGNVRGTHWDPKKKTKVLLHGLTSSHWLSPITNIWSQHIFEVKDAYVNRKQGSGYNVIVVDWTSMSTVPLSRYPEAARATQVAGEDLSQFLIKLKKAKNILSWDDVHILGHSLGAHVAGVAGNKIRRTGKGNVLARITGLDPAGVCFDTPTGIIESRTEILDTSDAKFVDIVHTNMGNIIRTMVGRYGSAMRTGHADFYPNGGEVQGGCNYLEDRLLFCSHQKSVVFYAKSITERIITCPCNDWDSYRALDCECTLKNGGHYFGEFSDPTARGKFFLEIS